MANDLKHDHGKKLYSYGGTLPLGPLNLTSYLDFGHWNWLEVLPLLMNMWSINECSLPPSSRQFLLASNQAEYLSVAGTT
jgi:hypothetical protein